MKKVASAYTAFAAGGVGSVLLASDILEWGIYLLLAAVDLRAFSAALNLMNHFGLRLTALAEVSLLFTLEVFLYNNALHFLVDQIWRIQEMSLPRPFASFLWEDLTYSYGLGLWRYVLAFAAMAAACLGWWFFHTLAV